ncbi:hypothetical protein BGW39_009842 [Mortierella sp. 14UC]|nr:hypothetical protein BGW39_009842 [Mortierella sp. 14UC]
MGKHFHVSIGHLGEVQGLTFFPDGLELAASVDDGTIYLFDYLSGKLVNTVSGHHFDATTVTFLPFEDYIASGSSRQGKDRF